MSYLPKTIELELSSYCNVRCLACTRYQFNNNEFVLNPLGVRNKNLDVEFLEERLFSQKWFKDIEAILCVGNNGDALANPDIVKIISDIRTYNPTTNLDLVTNGSIGTPSTFKRLSLLFQTHPGEVTFSIDGLEDTNHIYRHGVLWKKLMRNVKTYIDGGGQARWKWVTFKHNEHQVDKARELSKQLGFKSFKVVPNFLSLDEADYVLKHVNRSGDLEEKNILLSNKKPMWVESAIDPECEASSRVYISSDKKFYPCCDFYNNTPDNNTEFYNWWEDTDWNDLSKYSIEEALNSYKVKELKKTWENKKVCFLCEQKCRA